MKKKLFIGLAVVTTTFALFGCSAEESQSESQSQWKDGQYEGNADGMHGEMIVNVSIASGKITEVAITEHAESPGVSDGAIADIPKSIVEKQSTEVDTVTGATSSSQTIITAVNNALEQAK